MNVYQVNVEPKPVQGTGLGNIGCGRTFTVVTDTMQEAMSIARTKVTGNEEITGIYELSKDAVVDYSKVIASS